METIVAPGTELRGHFLTGVGAIEEAIFVALVSPDADSVHVIPSASRTVPPDRPGHRV